MEPLILNFDSECAAVMEVWAMDMNDSEEGLCKEALKTLMRIKGLPCDEFPCRSLYLDNDHLEISLWVDDKTFDFIARDRDEENLSLNMWFFFIVGGYVDWALSGVQAPSRMPAHRMDVPLPYFLDSPSVN